MKTISLCFLFGILASVCHATEIRVRNATGVDVKKVVVGDNKYGDIKKDATTDYQHWGDAYRYSFVSLLANSKPLRIQPIDYDGEELLGEGKFTYVLTLRDGTLEIAAEKDADTR